MFESIKHWFESLEEDGKLFEHRDDELLHSALASVLYHIIDADQHVDRSEKQEFSRILKTELDLDQVQVDHLYQAARASTADIHGDLHIIDSFLKHSPNLRMRFLQLLLRLADIHGAHEGELDLFYQAVHEIFPEVKDLRH